MAHRLLIIEDDERLREITCDYFKAKGFQVSVAEDGAAALDVLETDVFDIVFLDIMMPGIDGFSVCRAIRSQSDIPVVFLTARSREDDMLFGYELGADDYITKPFSLPVLHAKALALLARSDTAERGIYDFGGLVVNTNSRTATTDGKAVDLAPKEYELLLYLMRNKGIVLSRDKILDAVWGMDYFGDTRAVDTHIKKLRAALGGSANHIRTVIKGGYCFESEPKP